MPKVNNKERILKAAREKQRVIYKGFPKDCHLISQKKLKQQKINFKKEVPISN